MLKLIIPQNLRLRAHLKSHIKINKLMLWKLYHYELLMLHAIDSETNEEFNT